jgi:signal transduction histidine kinase
MKPIVKSFDLRYKLYLTLTAVGGISLIGGLVMIWYTFQMQHLLTGLLKKNIAAFQAAEAMETALVNQKGFVTYYSLDNDPDWLRQFSEYRQIFKKRLDDARSLAQDADQLEAIEQIETRYEDYMLIKDRVIELYKDGKRQEGALLHATIRNQFMDILNLCENYKQLQTEGIRRAQGENNHEARRLRYIALLAVALSSTLAILLSLMLSRQILSPLAALLASASGRIQVDKSGNIVSALSNSVQGLIRNADNIQLELEKSREHLVQAEKLALVGKLAAGMAHSIRNPFTSVKMRLFSLNRALKLTNDQKEDFEVISQEIRHIDTIVQNFLEFSRPPKLSMQLISPSTIVDTTLRLLAHRLKSYNVSVRVERKSTLPKVVADPEQIKEVLVNLMINACEAMIEGGSIIIHEEENGQSPAKQIRLRIADTGPGIPEAEREKIFQPFYTTKDDGTGLGLSIAKRIMDEHAGTLSISSTVGGGACFVMTLPITEKDREYDSNHR